MVFYHHFCGVCGDSRYMAHDVHPLWPMTCIQVWCQPRLGKLLDDLAEAVPEVQIFEHGKHHNIIPQHYMYLYHVYIYVYMYMICINTSVVCVCMLSNHIYIHYHDIYIYMYTHIIGMYVIYIYIHTWFGGSYSPENGGSADSVENDSHPWKSLVSSAKMWRKPVVPRYFAFWLINHIRSRYLWVGISRNDVWIFGCDFFSIPPAVLSTTLN